MTVREAIAALESRGIPFNEERAFTYIRDSSMVPARV
jgi:hypothetical protein